MAIHNPYALVGVSMKIIAILLMFYVLPGQWREVKRPKDRFTSLRVRLFVVPFIIGLILLITVPRSMQVVGRPVPDMGTAIGTVGVNAAVLLLCHTLYSSYRYKP